MDFSARRGNDDYHDNYLRRNTMSWLAVDEDGSEYVFNVPPSRNEMRMFWITYIGGGCAV